LSIAASTRSSIAALPVSAAASRAIARIVSTIARRSVAYGSCPKVTAGTTARSSKESVASRRMAAWYPRVSLALNPGYTQPSSPG
jgi:hypothetical protein